MDAVRKLITEKLDEHDLTAAQVSRELGMSHSWLQQFLRRGSPVNLPEISRGKEIRRRLAKMLKVNEDALRPVIIAESSNGSEMPRAVVQEFRQGARVVGPVQMTHTIPVYGHAAAGPDGQFPLKGNKVRDIAAPAELFGVREAYALYVSGTFMEPRYEPGETVYVNPGVPTRANDYVVAQIAADEGQPPEAYVKRLIDRNSRHLRLLQLSPRRELKFPAARVVSVHKIIMGGDG
jgi:phage repressor protein C with HTH and peptisase S24 domain